MTIFLWGVALLLGGLAGLLLWGGSSGAHLPPLLALLLPAAGLGALLHPVLDGGEPTRSVAAPLGVLLWSLLVLVGTPAWLDREAALAASLSAPLAARLHGLLPGPAPRRSTAAETATAAGEAACDCGAADGGWPSVVVVPLAAAGGGEGDLVVLPYEGPVSSMLLPVLLEHEGEEREVELVFDTGATLTALSPAVLSSLSYTVPEDAPMRTMQTANGLRESPLLLVDRLWLGGLLVEGVTAVRCDNCGDLSGLLGLNVSSQFRVEVDQGRREVLLRPEAARNRHLDVRPWLELSLEWAHGEVRLWVESRAPRPITALEVSVRCGEAEVERVALPVVAAHGRVDVPLSGRPTCRRASLRVESARW